MALVCQVALKVEVELESKKPHQTDQWKIRFQKMGQEKH